MNISIIHHYSITLNRGGEKIITSIATELIRRGHFVSVYSFPLHRKNNIFPQSFYYRECFSKKIEDVDVSYFVYSPLFHKLFKTSSPKIAGLHSFIALSKFSHIPINFPQLLYRHGVLVAGATIFNRVTKSRDLSSFDAIHIPNLSPRHMLRLIKKKDKNYPIVHMIPNWVDLQVFKPRMGKNDIFTVLFVGSEKWSKGYDIFCTIAEYLKNLVPKIKFIAVGINKDKGRNPFMEVHPFIYQDELLADIYSSSHILIHPTRADIFGITMLESLACGTPVLASAVPSRCMIIPFRYICFTLGDYVRKIIEIYRLWNKNPEGYELLMRNSRNLASRFDKVKIFPLFEKMLIEVAKGVT
jgi:glycosyltransferase involved in cell wall biosynthesis